MKLREIGAPRKTSSPKTVTSFSVSWGYSYLIGRMSIPISDGHAVACVTKEMNFFHCWREIVTVMQMAFVM
jgi:hypothetical protein